MPECPERSTTVALASGMLRSQDVARAQAHISTCDGCRVLVGEVGTAPTVRVADSDVLPAGATMTSPHRPSEPVTRASRPWIGRYRVLDKLGAGGMGTVYAAEDPELDRRVAIKLLHATSETASARLVREARALAKLRHPNVVTIYEVGRDAGDAFVAMELVQGVTLRAWLQEERSIEQRLDVLLQAGHGLAAAHAEGLVHRDFKPENVMVGKDGRVQVLDFGLAKSAAQIDDDEPASSNRANSAPLDDITRTGTLLGTPAYMAPEQFAATETDARTDQFAYCVALFEALHGFRPFAGATQLELGAAVASGTIVDRPLSTQVPPHVQAAILRGLSTDPAARFTDMRALLAALRDVQPRRRGRWMIAAVAVSAIAAAGAVWIGTRDAPSVASASADEELFTRSGVPAPQRVPLAGDALKVTVHRLSNGLTVWISPNRKSPRVEARLVVRAGSRDANGVGGLAHMVEHMTYKGTPRLGTLDFAKEKVHLDRLRALYAAHARATSDAEREKLIAQIDAETVASAKYGLSSEVLDVASALGIRSYNGSTDQDATTFVADVPSNKFTLWARLEGERLANPVFRAFHVEAGVVFDEIHQRRSSGAEYALHDDLSAVAFAGHPYELSPAGAFADIVAEPFIAAEAFHATWYVPNNAALLLSGDIDPEQAIPVLERELARWRPRALPKREPRPVAPLPGEVKRVVKGVQLPLAIVGWHAVPHGHADEDALVALSALIDHLGQDHAGRVRLQLAFMPYLEAGLLVANAFPVGGASQPQALAALDEVIAKVQAGQFSQETLAAVLLNYKLALDRAQDSNGARLAWMASAYLSGRGWAHAAARPARVAALSKADLVRVANTYLTKRRVAVTTEVGKYEMAAVKPPQITPIEVQQNLSSAFAAQLLAEETVDIPPRFVSEGRDYHVTETPAGALITVANTEDNAYSMRLRWEVGSRQLPLLCAALHALDHAGIGDANVSARRAAWFARAQSANVGCSPDEVEVDITGSDDTFDAAWQDIEAWLTGRGITDEVWKRGAAEYVDVRAWEYSGAAVLDAIDCYATYGAASSFLAGASSTALERASAGDAREVLKQLLAMPRTISYFGPRKRDALELPATIAVARARPPTRLEPVTGGARILTLDTGPNRSVNTTVRISLGPLSPAQLASARVLASYLSDAGGGVLWNAFRNARGMTYSGGAAWVEEPPRASDPVSLVIRFATTAAQLPTALELALSITRDPAIQPEQVARARQRMEEAYRANWIAPRHLPVTVSHWRARGHLTDPRSVQFEHTLRTGERELADLVASFATAPTYITISGDVSSIDGKRLQTFGTVAKVTPAMLFTP